MNREILARLSQCGAAVNNLRTSERESLRLVLEQIAGNIVSLVANSCVIIYTCTSESVDRIDPASRITAGESIPAMVDVVPRPQGLGMTALAQRRHVISYEEDLAIHPAYQQAGFQMAACFPLMAAGQCWGVLYCYRRSSVLFSTDEILIQEIFVQQAATAVFRVQLPIYAARDLARKEEELNRMRRAGLLISSRLGLEETLQTILQMGIEVTGAHYGIFRLVDSSGKYLVTCAVTHDQLHSPQVEALPIDGASVTAWVAHQRQPVRINDLRLEPWSKIYYPLDASLEMRSELAVPLIGSSGKLEGVINLESPLVNSFSEEDSHLLQSLAAQAVIAIQEVRLLDALQEIAQLLLTQSRPTILKRLVELASNLLNASASMIWILKGENLVLEADYPPTRTGQILPLHSSLTGEAVLKRTPLTSDNVQKDARFHYSELAVQKDWTRALIVPMIAGEPPEPVGAFGIYSVGYEGGQFIRSEWDKKILTCLANDAALAVQNSEHLAAVRLAQEQRTAAETFAVLGDVAANLLHHLNNKVGTIPVRIQGIQDKCQPLLAQEPYLANNLAEIERSAIEAMTAVRDNLSHLQPANPTPVNISECVREAIVTSMLPEHIQVVPEGLQQLPPVTAAKRTLGLVFVNLLANAADAMPRGGKVVISGNEDAEWINITISDNGPGIPFELQQRVFEFNFSGRASRRPGKLGFGLWWVKSLTSRLGGTINVESDGHSGTTFRMRLPKGGIL